MMKKLIFATLLAALMVPQLAHAQATSLSDPCGLYPKSSATASINSAVSTSLVALAAGQAIYVCSVQVLHPGGTGTMAFQYGTGATCSSPTVVRAAFAYNTSAGTPTIDNYPGNAQATAFYVPVANAFCALSTGTIVQVVTVTYVQR